MSGIRIRCLCGKSESYMVGKKNTSPCPHCGRIYTGYYSSFKISSVRELQSGILLQRTNYNESVPINNEDILLDDDGKISLKDYNYTCICGKSKGLVYNHQHTFACKHCGRIYLGVYNKVTEKVDAVECERIVLPNQEKNELY